MIKLAKSGVRRLDPGEDGSGLLVFCVIITAVFTTLVGASTNLLTLQFNRVRDDYHRYQSIAAAEAGLGHAHAAVETSKAALDITLPYGTRYKVSFSECSTVGLKKLWSINSTGWSISGKAVWTVQQNLIETLPGGECEVVQGSRSLTQGELTVTACP